MHSIAIVFIHPDLPPFIRISALKSHSFDFLYQVLNLLRKSYWKKVTVWCFCIQYMSGISFNSFLTAIYSATAPTTTKNNYFILNIRILHIDFNNRLLFISVRLFDSVLINRFRLLALCYAVIWFFTHKTKTQFRLNFHINNFHYVSFLRMHFAVVFLNRMFLSVYGFFSIILLIYLFD